MLWWQKIDHISLLDANCSSTDNCQTNSKSNPAYRHQSEDCKIQTETDTQSFDTRTLCIREPVDWVWIISSQHECDHESIRVRIDGGLGGLTPPTQFPCSFHCDPPNPQPLSSCCVADPPDHFSQFDPCSQYSHACDHYSNIVWYDWSCWQYY